MTKKISIKEINKNQKLSEVCGECSTAVFDEFTKCNDCGMILCNNCDNGCYCSSCLEDGK